MYIDIGTCISVIMQLYCKINLNESNESKFMLSEKSRSYISTKKLYLNFKLKKYKN